MHTVSHSPTRPLSWCHFWEEVWSCLLLNLMGLVMGNLQMYPLVTVTGHQIWYSDEWGRIGSPHVDQSSAGSGVGCISGIWNNIKEGVCASRNITSILLHFQVYQASICLPLHQTCKETAWTWSHEGESERAGESMCKWETSKWRTAMCTAKSQIKTDTMALWKDTKEN